MPKPRRRPRSRAATHATPSPDGVALIDSTAGFRRLLKALREVPLVAVDTEAASFHRFRDRAYLLQVSTRDRTAVIDPLAVTDLSPLTGVLADPEVEVVFHDADYDLRLLDRDFGFRVTRVFDTRIAAQFLNEPAVGLAALLLKYLDVTLDKKYQRADWSARPLSEDMIAYASKDTRYLPELRDILRAKLEAIDRLSWVEEEFALLERVRWKAPAREKDGYLRMKGARALRGRPLAVLRELYQWRERTAKRVDKAPFRIMNNEPLLALAQSPPDDLESLRAVRGVGGETVSRRGKDILKAIGRGLALPDDQIPRVERPSRPPPDRALEARLDRLKSARNRIARRLDLAPGVLCPNGTLEGIARAEPKSLAGLKRVQGVRQWQTEAFGEELLAALDSGGT